MKYIGPNSLPSKKKKKKSKYLKGEKHTNHGIVGLHPQCHQGHRLYLTNSESNKIAEYLDFTLKPLSTIHPSYIQDTDNFIQKIKEATLEPHSLIFTIDINDLYTNIETNKSLLAVRQSSNKNSDRNRPDDIIVGL